MNFFKKLFGLKSSGDINTSTLPINKSHMKVIIGLGNPGDKYKGSRHNVGWAILDALADKLGAPESKEHKKFKAHVSEIQLTAQQQDTHTDRKGESQKILLVKPLTFMNLSGETATAIKNFYKLENEDFIVIYDDIDLPLGELRYRKSGGAGTHNGMKSLIQHISNDFPRLRFGIENRPEELKNKMNLSDYVLGRFTRDEEPIIKKQIAEAISMLLDKI